jgi:hypothetical protein
MLATDDLSPRMLATDGLSPRMLATDDLSPRMLATDDISGRNSLLFRQKLLFQDETCNLQHFYTTHHYFLESKVLTSLLITYVLTKVLKL